jgi:hypothetical protein
LLLEIEKKTKTTANQTSAKSASSSRRRRSDATKNGIPGRKPSRKTGTN